MVEIESSVGPIDSLGASGVLADEFPSASIPLSGLELWEKLGCKDGWHSGLVCIVRSRDKGIACMVQPKQGAQVISGEAGLIADQNQEVVHFRPEFDERRDAATEGGAHPFFPLLIENRVNGRTVHFRAHLAGGMAEDGEHRGAAGFQGEARGAPQQGLPGDAQQLFRLAEAAGCPGGEDEGGNSGNWVRFRAKFGHDMRPRVRHTGQRWTRRAMESFFASRPARTACNSAAMERAMAAGE